MIHDHLRHHALYHGVHPLFAQAFAWLQDPKTATLADGTYDLDGDRLKAIISRVENALKETPKLEAHKRYIDIHYAFSGQEVIGWRAIDDCQDAEADFDYTNDYVLYREPEVTAVSIGHG